MKKTFLLALMVLGAASMQAVENQPTTPKPRPPHVKTAIRHHLYVLGIAIILVAAGCSYKFLLPKLMNPKK